MFYLGSVFGVEWGSQFCEDYNSQVRALLEQHGTPDWAPGLRAIREDECVHVLRDFAVPDWSILATDAGSLVELVSGYWDGPLIACAHVPDNEVFLIAHAVWGDICVEVLDVREIQYMSHYVIRNTTPEDLGLHHQSCQ